MSILSARIVLSFVALAAANGETGGLFGQIDGIVLDLSRITGWKASKKVPAAVMGKDQFRVFVEKRMKEVTSPEEMHVQETALKMFGLVPRDFDMAQSTLDLVSEQTAAFYDYNKKRLYILESAADDKEGEIALVHELAHALADQNYPLGKYIKRGAKSDDSSTARQAVMEGQATWLMWAYESLKSGGPAEVSPAVMETMTASSMTSSSQYPVFAKSQPYLRESLVFPYTRGLIFQDAVFKAKGGEAFSQVFRDPPENSQQIIHPEKYLSHVEGGDVDPPGIPGHRAFRKIAGGSFGELDHSILLRQHTSEAEANSTAPSWKAGSFDLWEHKKLKYPVLAYASVWETEDAARSYFELYQRILKSKWKTMTVASKTADEVTGVGDSGRFILHREGTRVSSIEGLK